MSALDDAPTLVRGRDGIWRAPAGFVRPADEPDKPQHRRSNGACPRCGTACKKTASMCRTCYTQRGKLAGRRARGEYSSWTPEDQELVDRLARNLANTPTPAVGHLCNCGCLLAATESWLACPACRVWAERDAIRASWLHAERDPQTVANMQEAA